MTVPAADVLELGGDAVGRDVAVGLELGLLGQNSVQDGVAHLVADLVGVPFGNTLGGKIVVLL